MSTPPWGQQVPEPPKKSKANSCAGVGCLGIIGVVILGGLISVDGGGKSGSKPAAQSAVTESPDSGHSAKAEPPSSTRKKTPQTVTYLVTGTGGADVQYGPAGSSAQGSVPMTVTKPLRDVQYYSITAQLQGGGHVTCQLKVNARSSRSPPPRAATTSPAAKSARTSSAASGPTRTPDPRWSHVARLPVSSITAHGRDRLIGSRSKR
jgi:hypothetical protein